MTKQVQNRKFTLALNSVFNLLSWFSPIILAFIATPIVVKGLGNVDYGLYAIILGFITYSFTLGIGKVSAKYIAEFKATGETEKINDAVSATFWLSIITGIAGTTILAVTAPLIVSDVLFIPVESQETVTTALYITCAIILSLIIGQVFQFVLHGLHRFGENLLITNINGVLLNVGNILLILNGYGILALLSWSLTVSTFIGFLYFIRARSGLPDLEIKLHVPREMIASVLSYGSSIAFYQIFANVLFIFERAWVMRNFGAEALAFYSIPMMLAIYMNGFVGSFAAVLFPVMNELLTNIAKQIELYKKTTKIVLAFVVFVVVTFTCTGQLGLSLWLSGDFAMNSYLLLVIHALTFGLISMFVIVWQIGESFRFAGLNVITTVIWTVVAIPLMIAAALGWGTEGIAIARLTAVCVSLPMILYVEKKCFGEIFWTFWLAVLSRVTIAGAAVAVFQLLAINNLPSNWLSLAVAGLGGALIYSAALLLTGYLTREERVMIGEVFGRKSPAMDTANLD